MRARNTGRITAAGRSERVRAGRWGQGDRGPRLEDGWSVGGRGEGATVERERERERKGEPIRPRMHARVTVIAAMDVEHKGKAAPTAAAAKNPLVHVPPYVAYAYVRASACTRACALMRMWPRGGV
jgi:hypothetical protein